MTILIDVSSGNYFSLFLAILLAILLVIVILKR